jgi:Ca-activated chloride channel family protein
MPRALFLPGVLVVAGLLTLPGAAAVREQQAQPPPEAVQPAPPAPTTPAPQPPPQQGTTEPPAPAQRPSFRAGVELVSLNVTVTDQTGRYLTELNQGDFQIFEDGAQQQVTFFNRSNLPIALSILLDTSASMESKLETAQEAAIGFVRRLRAQDLAQVIDFDSRVQVIQGFTNSVADLEGAIRRTNPGGSTSLHNAIYIALKELKRTQARATEDIRRQAIVVLSDGEDTSSLVSFDEVLDLAKRSETAIFAIGLRSRDERNRGFSDAEFVLRQLTQQTGGRVFFTRQISELASVYGQIADELSSQYTIGYTSRNPKRDGAWRRIVVRVAAPNASARAKQGYYAPTS